MTAQPIEPHEADVIANTATAAIEGKTPLEGEAVMPADLQKLRKEKLRIDARIEELEFRKEQIKTEFEERLRLMGVKSFTIHGKNKATVSEYPKAYAKPAVIATKYPTVYNDPECVTVKQQTTVTIRK